MRDFLAGLRHLLAVVDLERMRLGDIARQFIKDVAIPFLQERGDTATTDAEADRVSRLISEYEKYSNPNSSESRIFDKTAAAIVRKNAERSGLSEESMEDLMQSIAIDFFRPGAVGEGGDLRDTLKKFRIEEGPLALNRFWMRIVELRVKFLVRTEMRHRRDSLMSVREDDEGNEFDPLANVPAPSVVDEGYVMKIIGDLSEFMHRNLRKPAMIDMFDRWMELAQEKGVGRVDLKRDVMPFLRDRGYDAAPTTMFTWWTEIKRQIVNFFEKELEGAVSSNIKRMLRVSTAEILAYEQFRRRVAAWMLGGILRGTLAAGG